EPARRGDREHAAAHHPSSQAGVIAGLEFIHHYLRIGICADGSQSGQSTRGQLYPMEPQEPRETGGRYHQVYGFPVGGGTAEPAEPGREVWRVKNGARGPDAGSGTGEFADVVAAADRVANKFRRVKPAGAGKTNADASARSGSGITHATNRAATRGSRGGSGEVPGVGPQEKVHRFTS